MKILVWFDLTTSNARRARILSDCLTDPHMLPERVSGYNYRSFIWTHLHGQLKYMIFNTRLDVWFQHDGASSRFFFLFLASETESTCYCGQYWPIVPAPDDR
jgi:hypothetical protein